jgi:hypothetical protein
MQIRPAVGAVDGAGSLCCHCPVARLLLVVALLLVARAVAAQSSGLHPPCGAPTEPPYAAPSSPPNVAIWHEGDLQASRWIPASCLGWSGRSRLAISVAGEFAAAGGLDELLRRIGGFSHYSEIRFWAPTRHDWRPLVESAGLLSAAASATSSADASPDRFVAGRSLDYFEVDASGRSTYRMTVRERTPERVVLAIENTSAIRLMLVSLFDPGALQSVLFLEHHDGNLWRYYQATRAGDGTSTMALGSTASYVNRLTAFYGYVAGQPGGSQPAATQR